jgi:hypothetical protein
MHACDHQHDLIFEEHDFWLQILLDHLKFIKEALPLDVFYKPFHHKINNLMDHGNQLVHLVTHRQSPVETTQAGLIFAELVGILKREMLNLKLTEAFPLELEPTFLNHMLNELEEYIGICNEFLIEGRITAKHPLHHHKLWLLDVEGHLDFIKKHLDSLEKMVKTVVSTEKDVFHHLHLKTLEFIGYLRAADNFNELVVLNNNAILQTKVYLGLLEELARMINSNTLLGSLKLDFIDHMRREEEYYLSKVDIADLSV